MPLWKIEIITMSNDFCISKALADKIITSTEIKYKNQKIPDYYHGNVNKYLYDKARTKLMEVLDTLFA